MIEFINHLLYQSGIALYSAALALAAPFNLKAALLRKGRKQTFNYLKSTIQPNYQYTWFHAASLGEFEQGRPVIEALKQQHPELRVLLTFFSPSGYEVRKNYAGADLICYLPADTRNNASRLLNIVPVNAAVFIKYEFWYFYLKELAQRNIPAYSIAAIFRKKQFFFKPYGGWYRNLLHLFKTIYVQDRDSLELLQQAGIHHALVAGDTRFDRVRAVAKTAKSFPLIEEFIDNCSKVIVAGSTWPADEELLVRVLADFPEMKLILVPHEIHESHLAGIERKFVGCKRYTKLNGNQTNKSTTSNCLVIDTIGMLSSVYRYATIAYIGGGFGAGIHNTLEAAVWSLPVVFGPNYQKFREACELIKQEGGFSIANYQELQHCVTKLIDNKKAGEQSGNYVEQNTGATALIVNQLTNELYAKTIDS
jgi:3-deoxy-D-manno-octulosonic-acid transferase